MRKVRKGDRVKVISGDDRGKVGKVLQVFPEKGRVLVEGVNIVTKHVKPRQNTQQGGLIHQEAPINASKVMLVCAKCGKPTKVGRKVLENGTKARFCKKCGETIDVIGEKE